MRRALLALAAALVLLPAGGAGATIWLPPEPHDPKLGCKAIRSVVANLNAGRLADPGSSGGATFYSDSLGRVEKPEEAAFLHSMRHSEGRPDIKPITLQEVAILHKDKENPVYLIVLQRESWHERRMVDDGDTGIQEVAEPGYFAGTSYWLVSFISNRIADFREVPELFRFRGDARKLEHCHRR